MPTAQRIVLLATGPDTTRGFAEVNDLLHDGWRVAHVSPMGGGGASREFAAVIVLERSGDEAESVLERLEEEVDFEDELTATSETTVPLDDPDVPLPPDRTNVAS